MCSDAANCRVLCMCAGESGSKRTGPSTFSGHVTLVLARMHLLSCSGSTPFCAPDKHGAWCVSSLFACSLGRSITTHDILTCDLSARAYLEDAPPPGCVGGNVRQLVSTKAPTSPRFAATALCGNAVCFEASGLTVFFI